MTKGNEGRFAIDASRTAIRPASPRDAASWLRLRHALWPDGTEAEHREEIDRFFAGRAREPKGVLVAEDAAAHVIGVAELSIRPYAEGCHSDRVAYLEGWFVVPEARGRGVGRALIAAAEEWGRSQGCGEFASDAEADNAATAAAHRALGFTEVGLVRCFRKDLYFAVWISLGGPLMAQERPPQILQIVRESIKQGGDAPYKVIEEDAARICADLKCPNSHLAMESLTGPKEVWWLTPYESESDRQRVADGYASNHALMAALLEIPKRKQGLVGAPIDILANYRRDLSGKDSWKVGGTRFFVVMVTKGDPPVVGAVFEAPDGTRFIFRPTSTRHEADILAAEASPKATTTFAVRPYWGMPANDWIAADPEFWKPNPMARYR